MLMIWRLACGPSVKRENGIEIEMPCCRMKFELSIRKKTSKKATSTSATRTTQPKLKFIVRRSFMRSCRFVDYRIAGLGFKLRLRPRRLSWLLKADNASDRGAFSQHVDDLNSRAFHVMKHRIHARREIAICDKGGRGDNQACCRSQQTFVNTARKLSHCRVTATGSNRTKSVYHSRNGPK